jgi:hypothetical protein
LAYLCATGDTEIVIEGFPRCGNTFAVIAFQKAQERKVKIAHHLHVPAQIHFAVKRGIPALVLIREPLEAISSLIVRHPERTPETCFTEYNNFYRSILPVKDKFVVSNFNETVNDLGLVTARLNERFSTSFKSFVHTPENVESVFNKIDENNQILEDGSILQLAKPAKEREYLKGEVKLFLQSDKYNVLLKQAEYTYRMLIA